ISWPPGQASRFDAAQGIRALADQLRIGEREVRIGGGGHLVVAGAAGQHIVAVAAVPRGVTAPAHEIVVALPPPHGAPAASPPPRESLPLRPIRMSSPLPPLSVADPVNAEASMRLLESPPVRLTCSRLANVKAPPLPRVRLVLVSVKSVSCCMTRRSMPARP